jgi:hypothetical protein
MTSQPRLLRRLLVAALIALLPVTLWLLARPAPVARGKSPAAPIAQGHDPLQQAAQDLALADARVQAHTAGRRAEVFGVRAVGQHFPLGHEACAEHDCRQVEVYLFDDNATVLALVDLDENAVRAVYFQPGVQPGANARLTARAAEIARTSPELIAELGYQPTLTDLVPMQGGLRNSPCAVDHYCLAMNLYQGRSLVWAIVDLTDEALLGVFRSPAPLDEPSAMFDGPPAQAAASTAAECPAPGSLSRDGWAIHYETTANDGLRLYAVTYWGLPVITSAKLVEWHVAYPSTGFKDETGCSGGGGGYTIYPFGETHVSDLLIGDEVVGFEVVQDFRMSSWGANCNYRYQQHYQFFADGAFRVVGAAYGRGCSTSGTYRPVVRIDIAVAGDDGDSFSVWDGAQWEPQAEEGWWPQGAPYTAEGYQWLVSDLGGRAYYIEPGQGQFDDAGRGDNAYIYAVQHHPAEGDMNLGVIGDCCQSDHQQGPHLYINGESIADENIVIWYVPQLETVVIDPDYYCWTVGNPPTATYPCPAGPMFRPNFGYGIRLSDLAVQPGETVYFTATAADAGANFAWDFGDGGGSTAVTPTHVFGAPGIYAVTLTITDSLGTVADTRELWVGWPPVAGFSAGPAPGVAAALHFTNTTIAVPPSFDSLWEFGDGLTSTEASPTRVYAVGGTYSVTLTVSNPLGSDTVTHAVVAPWRSLLPIILRQPD